MKRALVRCWTQTTPRLRQQRHRRNTKMLPSRHSHQSCQLLTTHKTQNAQGQGGLKHCFVGAPYQSTWAAMTQSGVLRRIDLKAGLLSAGGGGLREVLVEWQFLECLPELLLGASPELRDLLQPLFLLAGEWIFCPPKIFSQKCLNLLETFGQGLLGILLEKLLHYLVLGVFFV